MKETREKSLFEKDKQEVKPVQEFMSETVNDHLISIRKRWPCHVNRVSAIGHPCLRYLVYMRLNWKDKALPDIGLLKIFRDGNLHEEGVLKLLRESGIRIIRGQEPFLMKEFNISGHIDGVVDYNNQHYPIEIKGLGWDWNTINSIDDMLEHQKYYIRGYPIQLMTYMKLMGVEEGLFVLKGKMNSDLKIIPCRLNHYLMDDILEKAKKINKYVEKEEYPDRITYDPTICDDCGFNTLCMPEKELQDSAVLFDNGYILSLLHSREELKEYVDTYKKVDGEIKDILNNQGNKNILCGDYHITGKEVKRKAYTVKASSYVRWAFKKFEGGIYGEK
jgi:CRISPR/Cas system-associated exonuclease Cas4 (RecB family)